VFKPVNVLVGLSLNDVCAYTPNILPPDTPAVLWLTAPTSAATVLAYVAAGLTVKLVKLKPPVVKDLPQLVCHQN
jgi:hypothetical protein